VPAREIAGGAIVVVEVFHAHGTAESLRNGRKLRCLQLLTHGCIFKRQFQQLLQLLRR
jgi:hypothetical protein